MTSEVFFSWFEQFCVVVKERTLLLIYDGHKTHLSIEVVKKAIKEKITLVKLPLHCTDLLQPLDKCCFGPLKRMWEGKFNAWVSFSGPRKPISKDAFANLLCEIWNEGISSKNVIAGFEVTGIYPKKLKRKLRKLILQLMTTVTKIMTMMAMMMMMMMMTTIFLNMNTR